MAVSESHLEVRFRAEQALRRTVCLREDAANADPLIQTVDRQFAVLHEGRIAFLLVIE